MTIKVQIKTNGNDAFTYETNELVRVLRETADKLEYGHDNFTVYDANGNYIGKVVRS